jgi:hypothetical protein
MIEWIKTKAILILGILLAISIVGNVVFSFVIFKNGLKVIHNQYITTNSKSDSYSSSGAMNINILGQQQYWNGKWSYEFKDFSTNDEMVKFINSLDICTFTLTKIDVYHRWIVYPKFIFMTDKKEGIPTKTYKEVLDK